MSNEISFNKLIPGQLHPGAIVPQALDNQWVPTDELRKLLRARKSLKDWKRDKTVLGEWRRTLVYAPQVVVNRAYFYNNHVIVADYAQPDDRKFFQQFLNDKIILPFLFTENRPDEEPQFGKDSIGWNQWIATIRETESSCVRLDWGDTRDELQNMASRFHQYAQTLNLPDRSDHLISTFDIPNSKVVQFRTRLSEIVQYATETAGQGKYLTRDLLYRKFICLDGTNPADGLYDPDKPFVGELKQIFDLRYNVNLPDAVGRYAFTPKGSPDRLALGDLTSTALQRMVQANQINELTYALRQIKFSAINEGSYIAGLDKLSYRDVTQVRSTNEWHAYIQSVANLLANPFKFSEDADQLYQDFAKLNRKITEIKIEKKKATGGLLATWQPRLSIMVAIGAAILKFTLSSINPSRILVETLAGPIAVGLAPFAINMAVNAFEHRNLDISLNLMNNRVSNGKEAWQTMLADLKKDPRFEWVEKEPEQRKDPSLSRDEDAIDSLARDYGQ